MAPMAKMEWAEKTFTAFPNCFFHLCRAETRANDCPPLLRTCCINIFGEVLLLCDSGETVTERRLNLKDYLQQSSTDSTRSMISSLTLSGSKRSLTQSMSCASTVSFHPKTSQLEIVAIDAVEEMRDSWPGRILVITCWGETCELGTTSKYQLALFRVEMHTGKAVLLAEEGITRPIAFCRFHTFKRTNGRNGARCILTFPAGEKAIIYAIQTLESGTMVLMPTADCQREFPEFSTDAMPGTVVKMATYSNGRFRWSGVGCDNGNFRLWRVTVSTGSIVTKRLRFFGAISILDIYQPYKDGEQEFRSPRAYGDDTVHVILSSTLGPAAIYRIVQYSNDDGMRWERRCVLEKSTGRDTITCSARRGADVLCIGFYSQYMLTYNLHKVLDLAQGANASLPPLSHSNVNSPCSAIKFMSAQEISLLTFAGHHSLVSIDEYIGEEDEGAAEEEEEELSEELSEGCTTP